MFENHLLLNILYNPPLLPGCPVSVAHVGSLPITLPGMTSWLWLISSYIAIALIPICFLAVLIGFTCSKLLMKADFNGCSWIEQFLTLSGHNVYSTIFFLFGAMMTSAMMINCFFTGSKPMAALVCTMCVLFALILDSFGLVQTWG